MKEKRSCSRRRFLQGAAAAGTALTLPLFLPASALGRSGRTAPSDRIVMGFIGVGSQGQGNMTEFLRHEEVQVVALCDVDARHRDRGKRIVDRRYDNTDCALYSDFRDLIGRGDLDAVALALPDHWHALAAVSAARAGLDIYGEKPLARSIRECRAICDAVQGYGRVWQTGSWQRSVEHFRRACEVVRNGLIGPVHSVEVGLPSGPTCGPKQPVPPPDDLEWEMWLGPAPWRPYQEFGKDRCHWDWRWIMDYSGGQLTDWAGHHIDIAHWGLGLDRTGPVEIEGTGTYPVEGLYDAPMAYHFTCRYAGGLTLTVGNDRRMGFMGTKWLGEKGWVYVDREGCSASDPRLLEEGVIGPSDLRLYRSDDHMGNFLECVRTRKETIAPVEVACRSISVGLLGEIAMLLGRKIRWDPKTERILNDPGASALLERPYRKPWIL